MAPALPSRESRGHFVFPGVRVVFYREGWTR